MAILEWPGLRPVDQQALCAELESLIRQVVDQEMRALDTLDDLFARMAAALLALLEWHDPGDDGLCPSCPHPEPPCHVLHVVHEYLKAPLALMWWHELGRRGSRLSIDEVSRWLADSETPRLPKARA